MGVPQAEPVRSPLRTPLEAVANGQGSNDSLLRWEDALTRPLAGPKTRLGTSKMSAGGD